MHAGGLEEGAAHPINEEHAQIRQIKEHKKITKGVDKKRKGGKAALETLVAVKKRMAFDGHSPIASTTQSRVKRSQIKSSRANSIMRTWQNTASRTT